MSSVYAAVRPADGGVAVLKVVPDGDTARREATALAAWGPVGASPALIDYDPECHALLIELVHPSVNLGTDQRLRAYGGFLRLAPLVRRMNVPEAPASLPDLSERVRQRLDSARLRLDRHPELAVVSHDDLDEALHTGLRLAAADGPRRIVHGDLHPANVILDRAGRHLVLDPKATAGPPEYDVAHLSLRCDPSGGAVHRAHELAAAVGVDQAAAVAWLRVLAADQAAALPYLHVSTPDTHAALARLARTGSHTPE